MKKFVLNTFVIASLIFTSSCKDKANEAETKEAEDAAMAEASAVAYNVVPTESTIMWKGFKPTGTHNGVISVSNGSMNVSEDKIESGVFEIDMSSITVKDIPVEEESHAKLTGHLKSDDFFAIETYPTSKFVVTGMEMKDGKAMLSGNLTLKDATNNITIPVSMSSEGDMMTLTSDTFTIDRSKWNVKYGSKSFFDNLGDSFINDDIELQISVKAKKE
ncbi:YceI family protein [Winogradskyella sp. A3E31]|uniref:YceI family protein n=1 Tax=Winogradskyella sp. A3E31 TaxID=3349637 RepID=UPI00398B7848